MKHEYVSIDRIFAKFTREISSDFSEIDLIEQVGEALEGIGTPSLYDDYIAFVEVKDFQAPVPRWCHNITQIAKDNRWTGPKASIFCPKKIVTDIVSDTEPAIPVALDCKGTPIHDYDLAFYRPFLDLKCKWNIFNNTSVYRTHYTPVRLHEHSFFSSKVSRKANSSLDEYSIIQGKVLRFSFRTGFIAIAYTKQAVDKETGYPLVPDAFSHLTAITSYITMMRCKKEFYDGRQGAEGRLNKAESDWQWYCGQASNNDKMLYGVDEHQNFLDQRLQLLPQNNRYFGFFGNLAQPQAGLWGGCDKDMEEIDECPTECETEEPTCTPSGAGSSSQKTITVVNNTIYQSDARKPLIGIAGRGLPDDPIVGLGYYLNPKLIGLNQELTIKVDSNLMDSYGINKSFDFNPLTGRIDFLNSYTWVALSSIAVDLDQ